MSRNIFRGIARRICPQYYQYLKLCYSHKYQLQAIDQYREMTEEEIVVKITEQYESSTGHTLHLDNPQRFTEKIQWRKAFDRDPVYSRISDKYAVHEWVKKKIGEEYLIPLLGVWESEKDIDFKSLPQQFVLKTNNASGTNTIVTDKSKIDKRIVRENYRFWLQYPFGFNTMELHYNAIKPLIIAEKFMVQPGSNDLTDYKFFCFDGNPMYCQVITDRRDAECIDFFDMEWSHQIYKFNNLNNKGKKIQKPENYNEMIYLSRVISKGFSFVRVDFYEIDGKIYFGEMTFTPASGLNVFSPDDWDYRLGELWDINKQQIDRNIVRI